MAGEVGSFVVGTDVVGGSGPGALPGTFNQIAADTPGPLTVDKSNPKAPAVEIVS